MQPGRGYYHNGGKDEGGLLHAPIATYIVLSLLTCASAAAQNESFRTAPAAGEDTGFADAPPPKAPFTDYRFEKPGAIRKITLADLPAPLATSSAGNGPQLVPRPAGAWPQVPVGFKVQLYASGLDQPRLIRTAPNGDFFVAESNIGEIRVFRGITAATAASIRS